MEHLRYGEYMLIALAIYVAQIYFSKWRLSRHYYGPLEWLWRQLSYGKKLVIKRVCDLAVFNKPRLYGGGKDKAGTL
jgi:uncharacterized protein